MAQPKYSLTPVEGNPWADLGETDVAGVTDLADPTGGATLTIAPEDHLTEHDKVLAHLAWLKAQAGSPDETSALMYSLDPRHSDDEALANLRMAQIRSGKWTGVGPHTGGATDLADVGARFAAHVLGAPQEAMTIGQDSVNEMARTGHVVNPDIAGRSLGLSLGLAAGGMSLAEPGAAGIFGGRLSQTADHYDLGAAKMKTALGADSASVWAQHGWYKDVDGNWKYEIPDAGASLHPKLNPNIPEGSTYRLGDALRHPELFKAYPEMADYNLGFDARGTSRGWFDVSHPDGPTVQLNPELSLQDQLSTTLHELQHGVQEKEDFARGAAPKTLPADLTEHINDLVKEHNDIASKGILQPDELARVQQIQQVLAKAGEFHSAAYKDYSRSAGEVEARNVQSRFGVTPEESRALHPDATADVEPADRRVSFSVEGGPAAQSQGWSPEALEYLNNEKDWFKGKTTTGAQNSLKTMDNIIAAGPDHELPISDPFHGMLMDAKKIHNDPLTPNVAAAPQSTLKINGWNPQAESHLMTAAGDAHLAGNTGLSSAIDDMTKAGPGSAPDPTKPNYWKLLDLHDKATELHKGASDDAGLEGVMGDLSKILAGGGSPLPDFASKLRPIDWANYSPNRIWSSPLPPGPRDAAAQAGGFNPSVPLFKGLEWHKDGPGSGLGAPGFADPANKPRERAIFATHDPSIAQLYAYPESGGYNMVPMYGRANNAHELNWRDISETDQYSERPMQQLLEHARANGIDALVIHGIGDAGGDQTQYAFMNSNQFRTRHAVFDPAKYASSDLLSTRGLGVRFETDDERKARSRKSIVLHLGDNQ